MANSDLTQALQAIQDVDLSNVLKSRKSRTDLLALSRKLTNALEGPVDRATDLVFKASLVYKALLLLSANLL